MAKEKKSRQGWHPDHYVLIGGMVPPRKKAIAMITAGVIAGRRGKMTVLDLIWRGVENVARTVGVLDENGQVTEAYRDAVTLCEYTIGENQKRRRAKNA